MTRTLTVNTCLNSPFQVFETAILEKCKEDGRLAARAAAIAACLNLTNTCLPAAPEEETQDVARKAARAVPSEDT